MVTEGGGAGSFGATGGAVSCGCDGCGAGASACADAGADSDTARLPATTMDRILARIGLSSIERTGAGVGCKTSFVACASPRRRGRKVPVSMREHDGNLDPATGAHHFQRHVIAVTTNTKIDA